MTYSPIIIVKKITVNQDPNIPQLNSTIRNCLFYCAYSKNLEGKLLQKQARDLLKKDSGKVNDPTHTRG